MNKIAEYLVLAVVAICKLLITGICLAIGFRIGGLITQYTEKKLAKKPVLA
jgi:uncharacterized protein YneF (UPF0154 family)